MSDRLVFLCGARDFHAMDWYFSAKEVLPNDRLDILTDLIAGEGFKKIISDYDGYSKLLILDSFLFKKQSKLGGLWRNVLKLLVLPIQVSKLKKYNRKNPNSIYYAHSMYYLWLAHFAKVSFIGTPQGSDILIKPFKSKIYRYLSKVSLRSAMLITVDSKQMQDKTFEISGVRPKIIQNGIDLVKINYEGNFERNTILSVRGMAPIYRLIDLLEARNNSETHSTQEITFIYPFYEEEYLEFSKKLSLKDDSFLGRLARDEMYNLLQKTKVFFSIPKSDSSPRSVYEGIFCGCVVIITYNPYYEMLPECMKRRIVICNLDNENWFDSAMNKAIEISQTGYKPSEEALIMFDQRKSFLQILELINF